MKEIRIKDKTGYRYEQYHTDEELNKRLAQLDEQGKVYGKDFTVTIYPD